MVVAGAVRRHVATQSVIGSVRLQPTARGSSSCPICRAPWEAGRHSSLWPPPVCQGDASIGGFEQHRAARITDCLLGLFFAFRRVLEALQGGLHHAILQ